MEDKQRHIMARALSNKKLPELDMRNWLTGSLLAKQNFARALTDSLIEYGFVIITNQEFVSPETLSNAYSVMADFYAQDKDYKNQFIGKGGQRGYTVFGQEQAKDAHIPDLKEFWHVGQINPRENANLPDNIWPNFPMFKDTFTTLYSGLEQMGLGLLQALSSQIDPNSNYLADMPVQGNSILRLLHYPPIAEGTNPAAVRAAAHEDINLITLLVAANGRGLQLLTRENEWLEVDTDPANIIVDAGDMLAHITGGKIPATTHRVINAGDLTKSRYSIPFFMHPRPECMLKPLEKFCDAPESIEVISAQEALERRLRAIGLL